jgi:hypothetical protein
MEKGVQIIVYIVCKTLQTTVAASINRAATNSSIHCTNPHLGCSQGISVSDSILAIVVLRFPVFQKALELRDAALKAGAVAHRAELCPLNAEHGSI